MRVLVRAAGFSGSLVYPWVSWSICLRGVNPQACFFETSILP
jgi:hypothetical protein